MFRNTPKLSCLLPTLLLFALAAACSDDQPTESMPDSNDVPVEDQEEHDMRTDPLQDIAPNPDDTSQETQNDNGDHDLPADEAEVGQEDAQTDSEVDLGHDLPSDGDTDELPDGNEPDCSHEGFQAVAQDAGPYLGVFIYIAQDSLGVPVNVLSFELVPTHDGATAPGTYHLNDESYQDCGNCVLLWAECDENLANCSETYLAESGRLEITTMGDSGSSFLGNLYDVVLRQVQVAPDNTSTVVPGGDTWCIQSYAFDATIQ